ncbi:MAG: DUF4623 domain-containing protein [Ignavibacteriaceae bacterium]|nr:DUF4623 domain-containing protein [Ignavibacteriaceae bacterium]
MKKVTVLLALFLLTIPMLAQVEKVWTRSVGDTTLPSWFSPSGNTERGFAYGHVNGNHRLYVVSRNGGPSVRILDGLSGADVGTLDVSTLAGGTFVINDFGVSRDGKLYGVNLATSPTEPFKIYHWASESAVPTVAFESNFGGVDVKRMGDNFALSGSASDNTLRLWAASAHLTGVGNKVYVFKTTDNGVNFVEDFVIQLPNGTFGGAASVYPIEEDSLIIINSSGKNLQAYTWGGQFFAQVPGGQISTGTTTSIVAPIGKNGGGIYTFQFTTGLSNVRIVDTDGASPDYFKTYAITPPLGPNPNINGTGDIDFFFDENTNTVYLYVLATNNGVGLYKIATPMIVNGRFHEDYWELAQSQNENAGFGPNINVRRIHHRVEGGKLYLSIEGKLDRTNSNGIALFIGLSNLQGQGAPGNTALGAVTNGGHLFGATANPNFRMGFETHYAFVINPGGNDSTVYIDAAKYTANEKVGTYIGSAGVLGGARQGPGAGSFFTENSITFAYDSAWGHRRGWEMAIPLSELGNASMSDNIVVFAVVVSSTAYFSDVTVPGNVTGGNPGFDVNWYTQPGGPYYSMPQGLPVELSSFTASASGSTVVLEWTTASELNNRGFEIERSSDGSTWANVGFVAGKGNTAELTSYRFSEEVVSGSYIYRLKQIDFDGTFSYSGNVSVNVNVTAPVSFAVEQNFPNPFNPETEIRYALPISGMVTLTVYNALGQEVSRLVNGMQESGYHSVRFSGNTLASGLYIYRLTFRGQDGTMSVVEKKMTMVK